MPNSLSPNMSLIVPTVGQEAGPQWAYDINSSLAIVDQHNHSPGSGVQITPAGINISSDLSMVGNNLTLTRSIRFSPQSAPLSAGTDIGCVYVSGIDLYYNDSNGNQIRLTQNGAVAGTPGSIANLVSPASASYNSSSSTFIWQSGANTPANMDAASYIFRNLVANSAGLTLNPPASMAVDYSLTLPPLPTTQSVLTIDTSGNIYSNTPVNVLTPSGSITMYGGAAAPSGYLLCDGTAYSRTTYSALYSAIGTNYGVGDGSTTFNVPDFRGYFPRGVSGSSGNDPDASGRAANNGGNSGNNVGSYQSGAFALHTHGVNDPTHNHSIAHGYDAGGSTLHVNPLNQVVSNPYNSSGFDVNVETSFEPTGISIQNSGGNETRPINVYVNFIIKT